MSRVPYAWDSIFRSEGRVFAQPHEDMHAFLQLLRERGARRLLDVGSGSGRHAVYFARHELAVCGIDRAPEGIRLAREWLAAEGLTAQLCLLELYRGVPRSRSYVRGADLGAGPTSRPARGHRGDNGGDGAC
jgi:protein-L-isoaspartate O-methyltransferase